MCAAFPLISPFFFFLPLFELRGVQGQSGRCRLTIFLLRLGSCEERFSPGASACCCRGLGFGGGGGAIEMYEYQKDFLSFMAVLFARGSN